MKMSRRQFLALALGTLGAGVGLGLGITRLTEDEIVFDEAVGLLDEQTGATLAAFAAAYVGPYGARAHYDSYFAWRAQNLPAYRATYTAFATSLDAATMQLAGSTFAEADPALQRELLSETLGLPLPGSPLFAPEYPPDWPEMSPALGRLEQSLWQRFHRLIIAEIVQIFLNTNAWIMLGYEAWPGQPRGLALYPQPVNTTEGANSG